MGEKLRQIKLREEEKLKAEEQLRKEKARRRQIQMEEEEKLKRQERELKESMRPTRSAHSRIAQLQSISRRSRGGGGGRGMRRCGGRGRGSSRPTRQPRTMSLSAPIRKGRKKKRKSSSKKIGFSVGGAKDINSFRDNIL